MHEQGNNNMSYQLGITIKVIEGYMNRNVHYMMVNAEQDTDFTSLKNNQQASPPYGHRETF